MSCVILDPSASLCCRTRSDSVGLRLIFSHGGLIAVGERKLVFDEVLLLKVRIAIKVRIVDVVTILQRLALHSVRGGGRQVVYDLVDLPLHEVFLKCRISRGPHGEEVCTIPAQDQPPLDADHARMYPAGARRMVSKRRHIVVAAPGLAW